jgi:hypothetical protein
MLTAVREFTMGRPSVTAYRVRVKVASCPEPKAAPVSAISVPERKAVVRSATMSCNTVRGWVGMRR